MKLSLRLNFLLSLLTVLFLAPAQARFTPSQSGLTLKESQEIDAWQSKAPKEKISRLIYFSEILLGKPYAKGPLGEETYDILDQHPLYSLERFDCLTYVETVMALTETQDASEFLKKLLDIRYKIPTISFENRNHFQEIDWVSSATKKKYLKDVTKNLFPKQIEKLKGEIDKGVWYRNLNLRLLGPSGAMDTERKLVLDQLAKKERRHLVQIDYLPAKTLIANPGLLQSVPQGAIIQIVARPDQRTQDVLKTNIYIQHIGFLIEKNGNFYFRAASSIHPHRKVHDVELIDLLKKDFIWPHLLGINILTLK